MNTLHSRRGVRTFRLEENSYLFPDVDCIYLILRISSEFVTILCSLFSNKNLSDHVYELSLYQSIQGLLNMQRIFRRVSVKVGGHCHYRRGWPKLLQSLKGLDHVGSQKIASRKYGSRKTSDGRQ